MDKYYTADEVAEMLKITTTTVLRWMQSKKLKAVKLGNTWRIYDEDLQKFLEERQNV